MLPLGTELHLVAADGRRFRLEPEMEAIPAGTITETSDVLFELTGSGFSVFQVELEVNGVTLTRNALSLTRVQWRWQVGFHAGVAELVLRGVGALPLELEVLTDPATAKLTRHQFGQMVGDILADTLSLAALSGHRIGIARGDRTLELARFEYLRQCFERVVQAVEEINRAPWQRLEREATTVPLGRAGGVQPLVLARASRTAKMLSAAEIAQLAAPVRTLANRLNGHLPQKVRRMASRFDNRRREHSDILMVLGMWRGFLQHAAVQFERAGRDNTETTARLSAVAKQARRMGRRLESLMALPLFEGVLPSRGAVTSSHLFRRVPAYRRFYRAYRDFLAGLADVTGDFARVPLQRTYDLYELWCFLRLARAAALHAGNSDAWRQAFVERSAHGGLILRLEARPLSFGAFVLVFQPAYLEVWRSQGPAVGSFSRVMQPDIALETTSTDGVDRPVILLDAKYRVEGGLNDAVTSIHTYRDALVERVIQAGTVAHRRTVEAGFLLTPQVPGTATRPWSEEDTPEVFFRDSYREMFRFGAITMRPGMSVEQCHALLQWLLSPPGERRSSPVVPSPTNASGEAAT